MSNRNHIFKLIVLLNILFVPALVSAQAYYQDAIRFSNTTPLGSARIQALGGASVALGADPSSIITNPAGLGLYNRSEITITPAYNYTYFKTDLNGSKFDGGHSKMSLDQISGVFSQAKDGIGGWLGGAWGISVQKVNDFNNSYRYRGTNNTSSIVDYFIEDAWGATTEQFPPLEDAFDLTTLAYNNYLIGPWNVADDSYPDDEYFSDVTFAGSSFLRPTLQQYETITTKGSQYQISFGYGGNFADMLYFGFNVGLTTLQYEMAKTYREDSYDYSQTPEPDHHPLNNLDLTENLSINGAGANLTIGLIVRPIPIFRIGASLTTPTSYALNDSYETTMGTDWNDFMYYDLTYKDTLLTSLYTESAIVQSLYNLKTPMKYSVGAALFLGKLGFVTLDADFLNYSNVSLKSENTDLNTDLEANNIYIEDNYGKEVNLKAGAEIRLSPLRLRAGYSINGTPIEELNNLNFYNQTFSAGIGVLFDQFYADFATVYKYQKSQYSPYLLSDYSEPIVDVAQTSLRAILTLGVKF